METAMSRKMLTGSFVALITPFNKDGSVDFGAFQTLLKFQEEHGSSAVLIMGSTGETSMLSPEEKKQIIVETAKMKTPRMPIFFGCTGNNTESTIANVRFAAANGADGAILAAPTMSLGGHGTANMTGNIAPAELATISTPWTSYVEAENFKTTYLKLLPLLHFTYSAINPVAVKSLMKALGLPAGDLRKPLTNLEGEALAKGIRIVQELALDKRYAYKLGPISAVAA